jgi:hypothetical protein
VRPYNICPRKTIVGSRKKRAFLPLTPHATRFFGKCKLFRRLPQKTIKIPRFHQNFNKVSQVRQPLIPQNGLTKRGICCIINDVAEENQNNLQQKIMSDIFA